MSDSPSVADKVVGLARDHWTFGRSENRDSYAVVDDDPGPAKTLRDGCSFRSELAARHVDVYGKVPNTAALADALTIGWEQVAMPTGRSCWRTRSCSLAQRDGCTERGNAVGCGLLRTELLSKILQLPIPTRFRWWYEGQGPVAVGPGSRLFGDRAELNRGIEKQGLRGHGQRQ